MTANPITDDRQRIILVDLPRRWETSILIMFTGWARVRLRIDFVAILIARPPQLNNARVEGGKQSRNITDCALL